MYSPNAFLLREFLVTGFCFRATKAALATGFWSVNFLFRSRLRVLSFEEHCSFVSFAGFYILLVGVPWTCCDGGGLVLRIRIFVLHVVIKQHLVTHQVVICIETELWRSWWRDVCFIAFTKTWFKILRHWVVKMRRVATVFWGYNSTGGFDSLRVSSAVVWKRCCKLFEGTVENFTQFRSRQNVVSWPLLYVDLVVWGSNPLCSYWFFSRWMNWPIRWHVISILFNVKVSLCFCKALFYCIFHL